MQKHSDLNKEKGVKFITFFIDNLRCLFSSSEDANRNTGETVFPNKDVFDGKQGITVQHKAFQSTRCLW